MQVVVRGPEVLQYGLPHSYEAAEEGAIKNEQDAAGNQKAAI